MPDPVTIDFYLGLGSRYSYLAATQIARIEAAHHCVFRWKPIASGLLMDRRGTNPFKAAMLAGQYDPAYRARDATRWAAYYGVPFMEPVNLPADPTLLARVALAAGAQGQCVAACWKLFRCLFVEQRAIDDTALHDLATELDLDTAAFLAALDAPSIHIRHDALVDEAMARGVFGVPSFLLGDQLFWGNDRLVLLEAKLSRRRS